MQIKTKNNKSMKFCYYIKLILLISIWNRIKIQVYYLYFDLKNCHHQIVSFNCFKLIEHFITSVHI